MMTFAWLSGLALATYNLVLDREDGQEEVSILSGFKFKNFIHLLTNESDYFSYLLTVLINLLIY